MSHALRCEGCKAKLPEDARFCPKCGRPAEYVYRRCPKKGCGGMAKPWDEFCPVCGSRLPKVESEIRFDFVWHPAPGELARRLAVDTREQIVEGSVTVRYDQQALLLGDGAILKPLDPGAHAIETTLRDLQVGTEGPRRFEVLYLDGSEVLLNYAFDGVPARDGIPCRIDLRFVVEVQEPERLLAVLMKSAELITTEGLRLRIQSEVRNAVEEAASAWPAGEIAGQRDRKDELARRVLEHMRQTLAGLGFALIRVETLSARVTALDDVREQKAARGVKRYEEQETVARAEQDVEFHRRKAAAWGELRKSVDAAKVEKYKDAYELLDFIRATKRRIKESELINDHELEEITASLSYAEEDREKARAFVLARLEQEQRFDLGMLEAKRVQAQLEADIQATRKRTEAEGITVRAGIDLEDYADEIETGKIRRKGMADLDVQERDAGIKKQELDDEAKRKDEHRRVKGDIYGGMKRAKAEAAATKMAAAQGLGADVIAALFAEEQPLLAGALTEAFSGKSADERAEMERRHAQELREILEATQRKDAETITSLVEKLSGALGSAARERATAGDREAATTVKTVGIMRGSDKDAVRKRCRVCHCEWLSDSNKCPSCGEAFE